MDCSPDKTNNFEDATFRSPILGEDVSQFMVISTKAVNGTKIV